MTLTQPPRAFPLGFHYFCDHRCWRCGVSHRCAVFARWSDPSHRKKAVFAGPGGRVASVLAVSLQVTMEDAAVLAAEAAKTLPDRPPAPGAPAAPDTSGHRPRRVPALRRAEHDSLVARGGEYAQTTWPVLQTLRSTLADGHDPEAADAAERLEEMCATVASKIFRAVSSALDADAGESDLQSDANGSAKVALLLIEESRQAWTVIGAPGRGLADGLPARFIAMLDGLETELLRRFPRAFEFVRPGFDTEPATDANGRIARALRATGTEGSRA